MPLKVTDKQYGRLS